MGHPAFVEGSILEIKVKFLALFALCVFAFAAFGQRGSSFYVSTDGSDSNPGTQAAPWRSVQHAADTARAGSTVNVRGGTYEERVSINASGNASEGYITFRSYPGRNRRFRRRAFGSRGAKRRTYHSQ